MGWIRSLQFVVKELKVIYLYTFLTTSKVCCILMGPLLSNAYLLMRNLFPLPNTMMELNMTQNARHDLVERHKSSHDLATSGRRRDRCARSRWTAWVRVRYSPRRANNAPLHRDRTVQQHRAAGPARTAEDRPTIAKIVMSNNDFIRQPMFPIPQGSRWNLSILSSSSIIFIIM